MGFILILLIMGQPTIVPSAYLEKAECEQAGKDALAQLGRSAPQFICVQNGMLPLYGSS